MNKYLLLFFSTHLIFSLEITDYNCEVSKLSNISSNRALSTLRALGYHTINHEHIYIEGEITENLQPETIDIDEDPSIFIVDIPDSQDSSLSSDDDPDEENDFTKYLSGISMNSPTQSDPIERMIVCYEKGQSNLYIDFLDILYNQLDTPAKQILIEALVIEINSDDLKETGLSSNYLNNRENISINTPDNNNGIMSPLSILYSDNDFTELLLDSEGSPLLNDYTNPTGYVTSLIENNLGVKINALLSTKSAEVLSRPSILVLDGRQARIQVGQQIPITKLPVSSYSGDEILIPDIEYLPVGIVLNIKPRISNNSKNVTMQVETIITETENFSSGVLEAPIINNRKVESYVRVANNTPFIIGGLISNKKSNSESKIPLLSKIPWLGQLFTWKGKQNIKKEVIVVITPHIINNNLEDFSRIIPQDASLFDSFGNNLFPNSYRLKESDIFDLNFITNSKYLNAIISKAGASNKSRIINDNIIIEDLLNDKIPGEEIITQRMIYEIIEKHNYHNYVDPDKVIFFNLAKNNRIDYLSNYFHIINNLKTDSHDKKTKQKKKKSKKIHSFTKNRSSLHVTEKKIITDKSDDESNLKALSKGILITINNKTEKNKGFFKPGIKIEEIILEDNYDYKNLLMSYKDIDPQSKPILLTKSKHFKRLYEVLVLQEVLKLNQSIELSIADFKRGLEIQFPSKEIISDNSYIIDEKIADYFYQINFYYEAFEEEFNRKTSFLNE